MPDAQPESLRPAEDAPNAAQPRMAEALTVVPVGDRVYRYSVAPSSTWTAADLGRILSVIVGGARGAGGMAHEDREGEA